jgi:hemolysin activation/secretion protein
MTVRLIGGPGRDSIIQAGRTIHVYDNGNNEFQTASAYMHLSKDTSIHKWNYKWFRYNKNGFSPSLYYNSADRLYVGINYRYRKQAWRHDPFKFEHVFSVNYSILQNALSATWSAVYPKLIGGWDLTMQAGYDAIRWTNYYGTGNESPFLTEDMDFYRMRSKEWFGNTGLQRAFGKSTLGITAYYTRVENKNDSDRFVAKVIFPESRDVFDANQYGGLQLRYTYVSVNDSVVPTKGFTFLTQGAMTRNFTQEQWFQRLEGKIQAYFPITRHLSFTTRMGGIRIFNDDVLDSGLYYQHAIIGGARTIRGVRRERWWGQTAVYNSNELRFITNLNTRLVKGRIGVVAFLDQGRVWMPGEKSNKIHRGYGPGLLIAPFNKLCATISYGMSEEISLIQIRLERLL